MEEVKTEKLLKLPSVVYTTTGAQKLLDEFGAFVGGVKKQKYVFLGVDESVVIESESFTADVLPHDIHLMDIKIEGENSFVEIKCRTRFNNFGELNNPLLNAVTIQGLNPVLVRGLEAHVRDIIRPQRLMIRPLFYEFPLISLWTSLVLVWFGEYRLAHLLLPHLSFNAPLSAFGFISLFSIAIGTLLIYVNFALKAFSFWFPYFELEGNLSKHRINTQKVVAALGISLLASGLWNVLSLLRGTAGH